MAKEPSTPKKYVKGRAAKELTKINKGGVKISRTNSNFQSSVPLKPGTPKANAKATNASKIKLLTKINAENIKIAAARKVDPTGIKGLDSLRKANAANKMKAQGAKVNSAPTSRLSQGRRGK